MVYHLETELVLEVREGFFRFFVLLLQCDVGFHFFLRYFKRFALVTGLTRECSNRGLVCVATPEDVRTSLVLYAVPDVETLALEFLNVSLGIFHFAFEPLVPADKHGEVCLADTCDVHLPLHLCVVLLGDGTPLGLVLSGLALDDDRRPVGSICLRVRFLLSSRGRNCTETHRLYMQSSMVRMTA